MGQLQGRGYGDRFEEACRDIFADPSEPADLVSFIFRDIRFTETEIRNHNSGDYFRDDTYRLRLLEFLGTPILLAHCLQ